MPRDLLRELVVLARTPEPDLLNVGNFVAEHAGELAHLLWTTPADLEASAKLTDDEVVTRLRPRLQGAIARRDEGRTRRREEDARGAAERLAASVCWNEGRAHVDERVLLSRELLAARRKHTLYIADDFEVGTRRDLVVDARAALSGFLDCGAYIDRDGVHLTWRGGRGRLDLYPQKLTPFERSAALVVSLPSPPRAVEVRAARRPTLLGEILVELGLA